MRVKTFTVLVFTTLLSVTAVANVYVPTTFTDPAFTGINNATGVITAGAGIGLISLRSALTAADNLGGTHTITLSTGTYNLTQAIPNRQITIGNNPENITINGNGPTNTTISNTLDANSDRILFINPVGTTNSPVITVNGIRFQNAFLNSDPYGGAAICAGGGSGESLTVTNCTFDNNVLPAGAYGGAAICMQVRGNLTVDNCTFTNNVSNDADGGAVLFIIYGSALGTGFGTLSVTNSTFTGNSVVFPGAGTSNGGALAFTGQAGVTPFNATINNNTFISNTADGLGGAIVVNNSPNLTIPQIHFNRFLGNTGAAGAASNALHFVESSGSVNADNNWWGCNSGPAASPCDRAGGDVAGGGTLTLTKWLQLKTTASPSTICNTPAGLGNTTTVTTSFLSNSASEAIPVANLTRLIGLPVVWGPTTLGSLSAQQLNIQASGTATATFTSSGTGGTATVNTQVDNVPAGETTPSRASITVNTIPTVTNPVNTTSCVGGTAIFTSTITGTPAPTIQWRIGATPLVNGLQGSGSTVSGATTATLTITNIQPGDASANYNVQATNTCGTATSLDASLSANAVTGGTVGSDQTICSGGDPALFTESVASTGSGALTYQWQSSTTSCAAGFSNIGGATSATYDAPSGLAVTTYYRRVTTSTLNAVPCTANSNCITVTINNVTGGTVAADQTICSGGDPALFTESVASTGSGALTYQWQSSTTSCAAGFSNIGGATSATYDAPSGLAVTTYYRRETTSTLNAVPCTANSNCITVTINNVTGGTVAADQSICSGGNPALFTEATASTGSGTLTYQWQSSTTSCAAGFGNIGGATGTTYDAPAGLLVTTYYRRVTTSTLNAVACTANSNCITVTINPPIVITNPVVTTGGLNLPFSQTFTASGGTGPYTFTTASALPAGITLSTVGVLSGTPTVTGTFPIVVTATDASSCTGNGPTYNLVISNLCPSGIVVEIGSATSIYQSNTITGYSVSAGSNRLLVVTASDAAAITVTGVTFNGTPMIKQKEITDGTAVDAVFTLVLGSSASPTVGNIVMTSASGDKFITATAFQNVDQVTPTPAASYQTAFNAIVPSASTLNIPSAVNDLVFDIFDYWRNPTAPNSASFGGGQTSIINQGPLAISVSGFGYWSTSKKPGAASVSMSRTTTDGQALIHIAFNIKAGATAITVTNPLVATGTVNTAFSQTFTASGGTAPYIFTTASSLPAGLTLSTAGVLSGTPTVSGSFPITVTATDANGCQGTGSNYPLVINTCGATAIATPASQTICSGVPITTIVFTGTGTTFNWTRDNTVAVTGIAASGSGNISGTLTNTTNAPVTVTFIITPNDGTCNGTPITATVIVNPTPNAVATPTSQTICSGATITTIILTGAVSGTTFNWTRDNTVSVTGIAASGSGNIGGTLTNTTNAPVTVTFTITPTANGCPGAPIIATVIVNPTPNAVATPLSQTICSGATITTIALTGAVSGTTFNWTRDNTVSVTGIAASGSGNISGALTNTTNISITVTFTITPTANGCVGTPVTAIVTVSPTPVVSITPAGPVTICQGSNVTLTASATCTSFAFSGLLSGANSVPANASTARGVFNGTYNSGTNLLTLTVVFNGLTGGNASAAHIHRGSAAVNGPVIIPFTGFPAATSGSYTNTFTVPPAEIANFMSGNTYINIHNAVFPGGEIRSQIVNIVSNVYSFSGAISGAQSVPANGSTATGNYAGTYDNNSNQLTLNMIFNNLTGGNASAAHIHSGTPVVNGPVIIPFGGFPAATSGSYNIVAAVPLAEITNFLAGNTYINIHNAVFPGGEIRGNIAAPAAVCTGTTYLWSPGGATTQSITVTTANTYTVTATSNGCSNTASAVVNVNPIPTVNAVANQTVCNGASTTAINFTGTPVGTVFNWTNTQASIGLAASGTGNITAFTATNVTTVPVVATITVTPVYTNGGTTCTGTPITFTITVNPTPTAVATPSSQTVCSATPITTIVITGNAVAGVVYNWTRDNTVSVTGIAASGSGNISGTLTNTTSAPITVTFTITPTANGCPGTPISATVLVNPTPNAVATPASQTICSGATITTIVISGSVAGTVYNWTRDNTVSVTGIAASGAGNIAGALTNTTTAPVTVNFTITPTANGCPGTPITATVLVNPTPTAVATPASQTVCSATPITTIVITGNSVAGVVYNWTRDNTGTVTGIAASGSGNISGTLTNTTNALITVTFMITPTANGCPGTSITATVIVNPTPDVNQPANQVVCNSTTTAAVNFSGAVAGTVYNWTNNTTSIGLAASGTGNIASFTATNATNAPVIATITVTPSYTNGGVTCTGSSKTFTITVNPTATVTTVPNQTVCNGTSTNTVNFSSPTTGGAIVYNWTNNTTSIGLAASGTGNIASFTATNATNAPVTATITVIPTFTNAGVSCVGTPSTFTVTVNPTATVNPVANQLLCNGANSTPVNFSSPTTGGTVVYNWTNNLPSIGLAASGTGNIASFTAINISNAPVVATITVTPVYTNGGTTCNGTPITFTITVNPPPIINPVPNQVVCNNSITAPVIFSTPTTGGTAVYNWTNNTPAIGLAASGTGNIPGFVATNAGSGPLTAAITVTMTYTSGGISCVSLPLTFTITVSPTPVVNAVPNQVVCNGSLTTPVNFTSPNTGGTVVYNWTNTSPAIGLASSGTGNIPAFVAINSTSAPLTATIIVTPTYTNGGVSCIGTPTSFTITVNPTPTVVQPSNQTLCNGSPTAPVNFTGAVTGTAFTWTNNNTSIGLAASGTGNIASFIATNVGTTLQVASITVTPSYTNGGVTCSGTPRTFTITVNPIPSVNTVPNQIVCNSTLTIVNFTGPVAGTVYSWTNSNASIGLGSSGTGNLSFIATNTSTTAISATITVTPGYTNGGVTCTGSPTSFVITVNPTPTVNAVANQVLCNGSNTSAVNFTGAVAGTIYNWTNTTTTIGLAASGTGNIASFAATNATNGPVTATITVTPTAAGCVGLPVTFTITVNPTPTVNQPANQTLCAGTTTAAVTFTGAVAGTVYTWTNSNATIGLAASGTGNIPAFTTINQTTSVITAIITVTPTYSNGGISCTGSPISFTITVNPLPNIIFNNVPPRVCLTDTLVTLRVSPAGGTWTGNGVSGSTFSAITAGVGVHTLSYTVTNANGCTSTSYVNVTVNDCTERHNIFANAIHLWPNPNTGRFNIQFKSDLYKEFKLKVVSSSGQEMGNYEFKGLVYGSIIPMDLRRLANGTYFLYIYNGKESASFPFVIAH